MLRKTNRLFQKAICVLVILCLCIMPLSVNAASVKVNMYKESNFSFTWNDITNIKVNSSPISISSLYKVSYDKTKLLNSTTKAQANTFIKQINAPEITLNTNKHLTYNKTTRTITPKSYGCTTITIKFPERVYKKDFVVETSDLTIFKGNECKIIRNNLEAYHFIKNNFYSYTFKGLKVPIQYCELRYDEKSLGEFQSQLTHYAAQSRDDGENFYNYIEHFLDFVSYGTVNTSNEKLCVQTIKPFCEVMEYKYDTKKPAKNTVLRIYDSEANRKEKALLYHKAIAFIESNGLRKMSDYNAIRTIAERFAKDFSYSEEPFTYNMNTNPEYYKHSKEYLLLNYNIGICSSYSELAMYICTLLGIPCNTVSGYNHKWNLVQIDHRWYMFDFLWGIYFVGKNNIPKTGIHNKSDIVFSAELSVRNLAIAH